MPTIFVKGRQVPVSDDFFNLPPEEQEATVRRIAGQIAFEAITGTRRMNFNQPSMPNDKLPKPEPSWSEVPQNIRPSAVNAATGLWEMITHPQRTAETLIDTAQGGVDRIVPEGFTNFMDTYVSPRSRETRERQRQVSGAVGEALYDRYGTWRNIRNTMITDPVGSALDVVGLATGAAGLVRGGLAVGSKANLAKTPGAALKAERLAVNKVDPMLAEPNLDPVPADMSNASKTTAKGAGLAENHPDHIFLTKDLGKMRHNYPPDWATTEDVGTPQRSIGDSTSSDGMPMMKPDGKVNLHVINPPPKPLRPFDADYSKSPAHDGHGTLLEDIDGDAIVSQHVAGRQTLGGKDIGFSPQMFREVSKKLADKVEIVPRALLEGALGRVTPGPRLTDVLAVRLAKELNKKQMRRVIGHEFGHAVHKKTGLMPITDPVMRNELERNYSTLATGVENSEQLKLPGDVNSAYRHPAKSDAELIAEAYYAAFKDPNYMKTVAPVTYATLRKWIKANPDLVKILINNGIAATTIAAALGTTGESDEANATEGPRRQAPEGRLPSWASPLPGAFPPLGLASEAAEADGDGLTAISKLLSQRRFNPHMP